jgi:hypothetical protein
LCRPTDRKFKSFSRQEDLVRGKKNTVAADVDRPTSTFFLTRSFAEDFVPDFTFNGESV